MEVLNICQDENAGISRVARVLIDDHALSGKILKAANSPHYSARSQVTTLERAVTVLGINSTLSLALSFSLVRGLQKPKGDGFDHCAYWKRSVISAAASRVIGHWINAANHDELFLAGLLQDIGMLAMNEAMKGDYDKLIADSSDDHARLAGLELETLGADHASVGAWLLRRWNLPVNMQIAAAASHGVENGGEDLPIFCKCILLANYITPIWTQSDTVAATILAKDKSDILFGMSSGQFRNILNEIAQELPEVAESLEVGIGDKKSVDRIMNRAQGAIPEPSQHFCRTIRGNELQVQRDEMTAAVSRDCLNEILPRQYAAAREMGHPFSILCIGIDKFESINDIYGRQEGDSVIVSVSRILRSCTRDYDTVARYGRDGFVILPANTGENASLELSRRIQEAVMLHPYMIDEHIKITVTISVGCATLRSNHPFVSANDLLEAAESSLHAAKSGGCNRVAVFERPNSIENRSIDCASAG